LRYHTAIFELLGKEPRLSEESLRRIERREQACGVRFPASVREWYSLEGAEGLLRENVANAEPVALDQVGSPEDVRWGWLYVTNERDGVASWLVRLDGSDDPPVDVLDDDSEPPYDLSESPWSSSFSAYVFDLVSEGSIKAWSRELRVSAHGPPPGEADLALLRSRFSEGPRTQGGGVRLTTYRFFNADGLVTFQDDPESGPGEVALRGTWCVQGRTDEGLYNLCRLVWSIGTLAATLESDCRTRHDNRADDVLRRLGRTIAPRPRALAGWDKPGHWKGAFRGAFLAAGATAAVVVAGRVLLPGLSRLLGPRARLNFAAATLFADAVIVGAVMTGILGGAAAVDWLLWAAGRRKSPRGHRPNGG